ncbi:MAG: hypothetical protein QF912_00525 [Dehalococcoidales bacterium]|nr:hypothetical protein [Dehalococcoidales bacterium]
MEQQKPKAKNYGYKWGLIALAILTIITAAVVTWDRFAVNEDLAEVKDELEKVSQVDTTEAKSPVKIDTPTKVAETEKAAKDSLTTTGNATAENTTAVKDSPTTTENTTAVKDSPTTTENVPALSFTETFGGKASDIARSVQQTADGGYIIAGGTASYGAGLTDAYLVKTDGGGNEEWSQTFGGEGYDEAFSVQQTADGGYIIAGVTTSFSTGDYDAYLVKIDEEGNEEWSQIFGDTENDGAHSVQQTADGGYIIAGGTASYGAGGWDTYVIKTDEEGNEEWYQTFGGVAFDIAWSVQQTTDGGYVITGNAESFGTGSNDVYVIKIDGEGFEEWSRTFGGEEYDESYSIRQTADGGYIIAGSTESFGVAPGHDAYVIKLNGEGFEEWYQTFGGVAYDRAYAGQQTTDGGYVIAGSTNSFGAGDYDFYLVKTDGEGVVNDLTPDLTPDTTPDQTEKDVTDSLPKTFGGERYDTAVSIQQTTDGGYIIAGRTESFGAGGNDAYLVKTDGEGIEEWYQTFGGEAYDAVYSVQQTADGGYIIAGTTRSFGADDNDAYLVKTDGEGNEEWFRTFGGEANDIVYSVQQTTDGGYIIAGDTESFGAGGWDIYLVKTDGEGNEEWFRTFGGENTDGSWSVQQTTDGGYIIAGDTNSFGAGNNDVYLVKTDGEGLEEWHQTFGSEASDGAYAVPQTTDGGYVIAGYTESFGVGGFNVYMIKTDGEGLEEWYRTFGGEENDGAYAVQQTADGGYIIAGDTESFGAGGWDTYMIKTDREGLEEWYQTFGGEEDDRAYSVQQTTDGGYVIAGDTNSFGTGDYDVYLVKTDEEGVVNNLTPEDVKAPLTKNFGGAGYDVALSVQQTADGGYIIAGRTESFGAGNNDAYLVKIDGEGNEEWYRTFGGEAYDAAYAVQQTADGGYIIAGRTESFGAGGWDAYLVKIDGEGNEEWYQTFGGEGRDAAWTVQQTTDGGYIITGFTMSFGAGSSDVYLVKTDGEGNEEWYQTFGDEAYDAAYAGQQTADGGYIIAGVTTSFGAGNSDVYLVKTDGEGNEEWYRTFGGEANDIAYAVQQTADGGYIIAGDTESFGAGDWDVYLVKTDGEGNEEWYRTFGGEETDEARSVQQTADGGYIIAGLTTSYGAGNYDVYLVKTDEEGNEEWFRTFGGEENDQAYAVQQTADGGYVIAGLTMAYGSKGWDAYLVKTDEKGD